MNLGLQYTSKIPADLCCSIYDLWNILSSQALYTLHYMPFLPLLIGMLINSSTVHQHCFGHTLSKLEGFKIFNAINFLLIRTYTYLVSHASALGIYLKKHSGR